MGGGLMQIVVKGAQDFYITNKPEITYYKNIFKRYVHFSNENLKLIFDGKIDFGQKIVCSLKKYGDLINKMYLQIILKSNNSKEWGYVRNIGLALIKDISLIIDGEVVETHTNDMLNLIYQLEKKNNHINEYNNMIGNIDSLTRVDKKHDRYSVHVPLKFWFNRHDSLALPILCLQENLIRIEVTLNEKLNCINYKGNTVPIDLPEIENIYLLTDYIYLQKEERNNFIFNKHQYLIDQLQVNNYTIAKYNPTYELKFGHPCKSINWYSQKNIYTTRTSFLAWAGIEINSLTWEEAKDKFAKLIWLATRDGLSLDAKTISYSPTTFNPGDSPGLVSSGNTILEKLVSKVDAYILFYNSTTINADPDNVALIRNDITFEDMTVTITKLNADANNTSNQSNFYDLHKINIIDIFNNGNFINGTDNPIINSNLKLNGHSIFNLDSKYFNYLQNHNKYKNSTQDGINNYSFAFNPYKIQPSGSYNFSKIDNINLSINIGKENKNDSGEYFTSEYIKGKLSVCVMNYNLFKIDQGKAKIYYNYLKK